MGIDMTAVINDDINAPDGVGNSMQKICIALVALENLDAPVFVRTFVKNINAMDHRAAKIMLPHAQGSAPIVRVFASTHTNFQNVEPFSQRMSFTEVKTT